MEDYYDKANNPKRRMTNSSLIKKVNPSGEYIEASATPSARNPPALRPPTNNVLSGGAPVESPTRPVRVPAPSGGGQLNSPALYRGNPQGFTFGNGVVPETPNLPQTQATGMNKMNLPQVRPPQSFGSGRIIPDSVINTPRMGLNAQPIDPTGGLVGAVYRAGSRATTSTDPLGNTTRRVIPGVEQMFGGYKDDATFDDARNLVRDAMKNKSGIKSHDNYNDPKTMFSKAAAPGTVESKPKMGPGDLSRMSDGSLPPGRAPRYGFASGGQTMIGDPRRHDQGALERLNSKVKGNPLLGGPKEWVDNRGRGYDEQVAQATRANAIEKDYQDNKSVAQRRLDLSRGNGTWDMDAVDINKSAQTDFDAVQKRNAAALADATTRRGQDETSAGRKQQSTDALEGRKFQAEQGRLGREAVTSEGALNRADAAKARSEDLRYKVNAESEAKANEVIKEAGVSAEKTGKDPEEAMYRMQAQLGRGTYKKGALAKKDTSRFWQSDNSEPEVPYSYTPNRAKTASAGKDRPGLKYLGIGDNGEMVYLNAKGEQVTD